MRKGSGWWFVPSPFSVATTVAVALVWSLLYPALLYLPISQYFEAVNESRNLAASMSMDEYNNAKSHPPGGTGNARSTEKSPGNSVPAPPLLFSGWDFGNLFLDFLLASLMAVGLGIFFELFFGTKSQDKHSEPTAMSSPMKDHRLCVISTLLLACLCGLSPLMVLPHSLYSKNEIFSLCPRGFPIPFIDDFYCDFSVVFQEVFWFVDFILCATYSLFLCMMLERYVAKEARMRQAKAVSCGEMPNQLYMSCSNIDLDKDKEDRGN